MKQRWDKITYWLHETGKNFFAKVKHSSRRAKILMSIIVLLLLITLVGGTYALLTSTFEKKNTFTITTGTLTYELASSALDENRQVTVPASGEIEVDLMVTSLNDIDSTYLIYYEGGNASITAAYYNNGIYDGEADILAKAKQNITVSFTNTSSSPVTLTVGIQGGLYQRELVLAQGNQITAQILGDIVSSWRYIGDGESPDHLPQKGEGYQVTEVICNNGTGAWDNGSWELIVNDIQNQGASCVIIFDDQEMYVDDSGANPPELIEGLIPVTWNGSNWVKADIKSEWYDYDKQMWANAVTVTSASRTDYTNASVDTVISMDDIETMWVWVPRYSYTIKGTETFKFVSNNSNQNSTTATSTFTFTPTESGTLSFTYDMQSETNYDKFTAKLNSTTLVNARSGTYSNQRVTANVTAGTSYTLTFQYSKDSSNHTGTDNVTVYNLSIPGVDVSSLTDSSTSSYKFTKSSNGINYYGAQGYGGSIPSATTPGAIDIKFVSTSTKESGKAQYTGSTIEEWRTPDGFTFGNEELAGIWVAKFETSSSNPTASSGGGNDTSLDPIIKPNTTIWRSITLANMFTNSQKLTTAGNRYGLSTSADSHMMKDSEWGVVAYLSQSKYGKYGNTNYTGSNKEIYNNNHANYQSGCSSGSPDANSSSSCAYTYEKESSGTGASTTGTIYGAYDFVGGAIYHTMANYNDNIAKSGFSTLPESKYYDKYTSTNNATACNGSICYGYALSETSGWYGGVHGNLSSSTPWYKRGSIQNSGSASSIFAFDAMASAGGTNGVVGYRIVLVP